MALRNEAEKQAAASRLGIRRENVDGERFRAVLDRDDVASWHADSGDTATLGAIVLTATPDPRRFYQMILAAALDMQREGYRYGRTEIADAEMLTRLVRDVAGLTVTPIGYQPLTPEQEAAGAERVPTVWALRIGVQECIDSLRDTITRLPR